MAHHIRKNYARVDRLKEMIFQDLSTLLRQLKDPRLSSVLVTISEVFVTRDYSQATVYYTVCDISSDHTYSRSDVQVALERARGFLRTELAQRIQVFKIPELLFVYDESIERGQYISQLIDEVSKEKPIED